MDLDRSSILPCAVPAMASTALFRPTLFLHTDLRSLSLPRPQEMSRTTGWHNRPVGRRSTTSCEFLACASLEQNADCFGRPSVHSNYHGHTSCLAHLKDECCTLERRKTGRMLGELSRRYELAFGSKMADLLEPLTQLSPALQVAAGFCGCLGLDTGLKNDCSMLLGNMT